MLIVRVFAAVLLLFALVFVVDYAWLRRRIARDRDAAYDMVQVEVVYQIPHKGNKAEYVPAEPQMQSCVRALFPHLGNEPCWYLRRHTQQQVNF